MVSFIYTFAKSDGIDSDDALLFGWIWPIVLPMILGTYVSRLFKK